MLRLTKRLVSCGPRSFVRSVTQISTTQAYEKGSLPPTHLKLLPLPKYGGEHFVTLLTGNHMIGRQGASYVYRLIETTKVPIAFERIYAVPEPASTFNKEFYTSVYRNRTAIYVDFSTDHDVKRNMMMLSNSLDLYITLCKMESVKGFNCIHPGLKLTLLAMNNTGDLSQLSYSPVPGVVETLTISTRRHMKRFLKYVFKYAIQHHHEKITFGHKMNNLPRSDGLFVNLAQDMACDYPEINVEFMPINELSMKIVMRPSDFDIICVTGRDAAFMCSICSAVCGGASLFSARDMSDSHAIFKPLQTKLSLTNFRNLSPYGIVRACIDLLGYLGNKDCAKILHKELCKTMLEYNIRTPEFGGKDTGEYVICNIVNRLKCKFA